MDSDKKRNNHFGRWGALLIADQAERDSALDYVVWSPAEKSKDRLNVLFENRVFMV